MLFGLLVCIVPQEVQCAMTDGSITSSSDQKAYIQMFTHDGVHYASESKAEYPQWIWHNPSQDTPFQLYCDKDGETVYIGPSSEDLRLSMGTSITVEKNSPYLFRLPQEAFEESGSLSDVALMLNLETMELKTSTELEKVSVEFTPAFENLSVMHVYGPVEFSFREDIYWNDWLELTYPMPDGAPRKSQDEDRTWEDDYPNAYLQNGNTLWVNLIQCPDDPTQYRASKGLNGALVDSEFRVIDIDFSSYRWYVDPWVMVSKLEFSETEIVIKPGESKQLAPDVEFIPGVDTTGFKLVWYEENWVYGRGVTPEGVVYVYEGAYEGDYFTVFARTNEASGLIAKCKIIISDGSGISDADTDDATQPVRYYDLQGRELAKAPASGMYIQRRGNTSRKILR